MYLRDRIDDVGPASPGYSTELDEVSKRLLAAADVIRQRGLCQGYYSNLNGAVCTIGSLLVVFDMPRDDEGHDRAANVPGYLEAVNRVIDVVKALYIPSWNDAPGRTAQEVIAALESAALNPCEARASQ